MGGDDNLSPTLHLLTLTITFTATLLTNRIK